MSKEYHCLIAGLPDLLFDNLKPGISVREFKLYLKEELAPEDYRLIESYFWRYDNLNLLSILEKKDFEFNTNGNLSREDFESIFLLAKDDSLHSFEQYIPAYFETLINAFNSETALIPNKSWENQAASLYFEYLRTLDNPFICSWYDYEMDLSNILAASNCRKHMLNIEQELVSSNEITEKLIKSGARDFGIGNEFPMIDQLLRTMDEPDLLEREKKTDMIRWNLLDEWTFFHYFTVERIFAYMTKLEIVERWMKLDKKTGEELFHRLLTGLETSYGFPEEFK